MPNVAEELVTRAARSTGRAVILTGAGISAESGIPTFRGDDGYWRVGSRNYQPQELATAAAFARFPEEIWGWYLYRRAACLRAAPNAAHLAIAELERALGDRFLLVTQNVDGLHLRAGNSRRRTYEIHGNVDFMRCAEDCSPWLAPLPALLDAWDKREAVGPNELMLLRCEPCGGLARPHVLWFDESYDEEYYSWNSSIGAAAAAALFVVIGTSGTTNLPMQMASVAVGRGTPFIVINPDPSGFTLMAERVPHGHVLTGTAGALVPSLMATIARLFGASITARHSRSA